MSVKKLFISADIEGVNNIATWDETELKEQEYAYFRKQMTEEVKRACIAAHEAGVEEILVKDAHDYARNIIFSELPDYVKLHRGWEGGPCSMMAGLDESFDACMFIGYHSPSRSDGNPLAHTMNTRISYVKINGEIASEFYINSLYASYLGVPTAFLSGDANLTKQVKEKNSNIETVATKEGVHGAVISRHPNITNKEIEDTVKKALNKGLCSDTIPISINNADYQKGLQYIESNRSYKCFPKDARLSEYKAQLIEKEAYEVGELTKKLFEHV